MCSAYLFLVPANVYFQAVSGTGNTRTALVMELITLVFYVAYITYIILYLKLDVALCWTSEWYTPFLYYYFAGGILKEDDGKKNAYNLYICRKITVTNNIHETSKFIAYVSSYDIGCLRRN